MSLSFVISFFSFKFLFFYYSGAFWYLLCMSCLLSILHSVKIELSCILLNKYAQQLWQQQQWYFTFFMNTFPSFAGMLLPNIQNPVPYQQPTFPTLTLSSINLYFPWMTKDRMSSGRVCEKKEGRTNWIVLLPQNICISFPQTLSQPIFSYLLNV